MSAEPSDEGPASNGLSSESRADVAELHARRREARRRRHLARVDVGLGLAGALVLVIATPGLAITGLVALIVLALCGLTFAVDRRRRPARLRGSREPRSSGAKSATPR
jgi:peptidoglycan/LPS O-acetylase OafA/YrhL